MPNQSGVYALCDLDEIPIYVGKSRRGIAEGIGSRVKRHLTSARSDIVANRQLDIWEIAHVWAWPLTDESKLDQLESHLFHQFDAINRLINGTVPVIQEGLSISDIPTKIEVQIMDDSEINIRRKPALRFPRQVQQFNQLLDYILVTKDAPHLRRALDVHFDRVSTFYKQYSAAEE